MLRVLGVGWGKKFLLNLLIAHLFPSQVLRKLLLNDRMCSGNAIISQPIWATLFWSKNHQVGNNSTDSWETKVFCFKWRFCCLVGELCPTLCDFMDCSPPDSSVHGIFQANILEWVANAFSRGSSWPKDWTYVSALHADSLQSEPLGKTINPKLILLTQWLLTVVVHCSHMENLENVGAFNYFEYSLVLVIFSISPSTSTV